MNLKTKYIQSGVDPVYVNITGDTMTGALVLSSNPTEPLQAATKQYVDQLISSVGGSPPSVLTLSSNTTLNSNSGIVLVNATTGPRSITLASPTTGTILHIKKIDQTLNTVTITPPTGTIDGLNNGLLKFQYDSLTITTDGSNYYIV